MSEEKRVWKLDDAELEGLLDEALRAPAMGEAERALVERIVGRTRLDLERLGGGRGRSLARKWAWAAGLLLGVTAGAWWWGVGVSQENASRPTAAALEGDLDQRLAVVLGEVTEKTAAQGGVTEAATSAGTEEEASLAWLSGVSETVSEISGESVGEETWGTWVQEGEVGKF